MSALTVREASLDDASRILEIYAPYITDTVISFEYEIPDIDAFRERMRGIMRRFPYLVCEEDGRVIGYAYAGTYMTRPAYDWCAEVSIYVDRERRGCGAGKLLYKSLFGILKERGFQNLYAVITAENKESIAFHKSLGFEPFAVFEKVGYKQGRWLDVAWLQLFLGDHKENPVPVSVPENEDIS